ncbi:uncharacterized protein RSE6_06051 [Rhynchosporium secalis]|uniref:Uncharacterized protein n=1 Tax=Rhynchosporium secalis TaxID=38038 RepID=A0A1E1M9F3_RHYSE|nr:uncharacterized protein RSE6_06051 [Rhynchosporium secalis]
MADSPIAETFGPGKIVLKKKKKGSKWHRLDLSGSVPADNEAEDEASSNPASSAPTRASTPNLMLTSDLSRSPPPTSFEPLSITTSDCANTHPLSQEHTAALNIKKKSEISEGNTGSENRPDSESEFEGFAADSFEVQHPAVSGSFRLSNTYSDQPYSAGLHSTPTQAGIASSLSFADSEYIDNDPTPRVAQGGFPASFESHNSLSETDWATFDDIDRSDTQSTKDRTEAVLAQLSASIMVNNGRDVVLDDVFDSADWDPEMPKGPSPTASPELLPLGLKPVAYTTVGSLVDPSNIPQFSAPNRIQREGANRRPVPLSMMQLRQFDSSFYNQQRGPPPPLNMSNSMQYAQQLGRNPSNSTMPSSAESQSSGSAMSRSMSGHMPERSSEYDSLGPQELTEHEELSLAQQLNIQESYCYGSTSYDDGNKPVFKVMPTVDENRNVHSVRDMLDEDARRRSHSYHGSLQGMDKMQTLQRLSKFENPMQEACRNRLAELSVKGKPANGSASLTPYNIAVQDQNSAMYSSTEEAPIEKLIVNIGLGRGGELNRSYQFPPPGLATNPLLASFSNSALQQAFIQPRPPGYPQPLTAGPPRRSQFPAGLGSIGAPQSNSQQVQQMENSADGTKPKAGISIAPPVPTNSHYYKAGAMGGAPPLLIENRSYPSTKIQDTLSAQDAMMRYYPNGLPPDFNYKWNPISSENAKLIGERVPTEEERNAARLKGQQDWFYQGQRRYATMKGQDHIEELEMRNKQTDKFGNIAPPKPINHAVIPAFITPEQARNISTSEATIPLLDATFGTLLAYAEASNSSRSRLSKFVTPDAHLIDASPTGNDSSFGEDWGPPGGPRGSRASVSVANSSRASSIAASSRGGGVKISLFERFNSGKHGKN